MTLYFEDVKVGDLVPPFVRRGSMESWNRFAAVNDEFMPVHMDHEAAKARGEKDVYGTSNLRFAYLHCMLREWIGDDGSIRAVSCQHRGMNYKNDTMITKGSIEATRVVEGEHLVDLEVWVENQRGERINVGRATVSLPSRA